MSDRLDATNVAVVLAPRGTEQVEFTEPKATLEDAGANVDVVGTETGEAQAIHDDLGAGDTFEVERSFTEITADDYDALVVPGGTVGGDTLRANEEAVEFVRAMADDDRPMGVICHGPWLLVEAGVAEDRTLTSYPSLRTDVRNAGGVWVDEEVVVDDGVITSRNLDDLDAFCDALVEEFGEDA